MPIGFKGKATRRVYFNGVYWQAGWFNGRKVLATPDTTPWLLVQRSPKKIFLALTQFTGLLYTFEPKYFV